MQRSAVLLYCSLAVAVPELPEHVDEQELDPDVVESLVEETELAAPDGWERLTERQREIYAIRMSRTPPLSYREVALKLGIQRTSVEKAWGLIRKSLGLTEIIDTTFDQRPTEETVAFERSLPTNDDLAQMSTRKAHQVLSAITSQQIKKATLRDKVYAFNTLMSVRGELLKAPAERRRMEERQQLDTVMQAFMQEVSKRGLTIKIGDEPEQQSVESVIDVEASA